MFECNGYVYGGKPQESIKVKAVKPLKDMMMIVVFTNGEHRLFDATVLEGTVFEPLQDYSVFNNAKVEYGVVTWNDGMIDCAPEFMYEHSFEYANVS